ncbi:MAG: DUF4114 domain-containing protein [Flavobacteriales bacterium]|nr:DUF4114 domain-containing protein [Flavobacteriales bacterium]
MYCKISTVALLTVLFTTPTVEAQYAELGSWDSNGVPNYLLAPGDEITSQFLEFINLALPEQSNVAQNNPMLLTDEIAELHIHDTTEVFLTFTHEGAGWKNSLAFYTFSPEDQMTTAPPTSDLTMVFPNCSYANSGGGLQSGNKVSLGTFTPGTCIAFALVAKGWKPYAQQVTNSLYTLYSHPAFNPETDTTLRQHCITLYDELTSRVTIGFEDIHREWGSCDHDFNDVLFFASASNPAALNGDDYLPLDGEDITCFSVPEQLGVTDIKLYKTTCSWDAIEGADEYRVRFRKWNTEDPWEYRNAASDTAITLGLITPLEPETYYEWQTAVTCADVQTHNSEKHVFQTLIPCEMPAGLVTMDITGSSAMMMWTPVDDIDHYILRFREVGTEDWEWRNTGTNHNYAAVNLVPNTTYEWSVNAFCSQVISCFGPYGSHVQFSTVETPAPVPACENAEAHPGFELPQLTHCLPVSHLTTNAIQTAIHITNSTEIQILGATLNSAPLPASSNALQMAPTDGDWPLLWSAEAGIFIPVGEEQVAFNPLLVDSRIAWSKIYGIRQMETDGPKMLLTNDLMHGGIYLHRVAASHHNHRNLHAIPQYHLLPDIDAGAALFGDFNNDDLPDIVVSAPETIHIITNRTWSDTLQWVTATYDLPGTITHIDHADLNGDQRTDLIYTFSDFPGIWYQQNLSDQGLIFFGEPTLLLESDIDPVWHTWSIPNHAWIAFSSELSTELRLVDFQPNDEIVPQGEEIYHLPNGIKECAHACDSKGKLYVYILDYEGYLWKMSERIMTINRTVPAREEYAFSQDLPESLAGELRWELRTSGIRQMGHQPPVSLNLGDTLIAVSERQQCSSTLTLNKWIAYETMRAELNVYPNPARSFINVEYRHPSDGLFRLYVTNTAGQQVVNQQFYKESGLFHVRLGLGDFPPGTYILTVVQDARSISETFLIVP